MNDKRLDIGDIGEKSKNLEGVDEAPSHLLSALDFESEDAGGAIGEILEIALMVGVRSESRVINLGDLWVSGEKFYDLEGVLDMTLDAKWERLDALKKSPGVERRDAGASVAENDGADAGDEGCRTGDIGKNSAMVGRVGLGDSWVAIGMSEPVELAAVDDYATE